ncbi:DUF4489 domain-containing protein [Anaeromicrobium sediminis]|uniref:Uncharacterized protein n=1 Tax=Anaeromicrobium sediminis TaxID=1478221 RepID=A0A267MN45_9FIRM|nr:DUF4489 domain-containing protein [Anaeromicrobium sediminis]PAB60243.1 hypothetical protein CCE28_04915 [Anaeromicrobium sediminis]
MSTYYNYKKKHSDKEEGTDCILTLECGKIFDPYIPSTLNDNPSNPMMPPIKLASVTVDTRSLRKAYVNIEFSSIISVVNLNADTDSTITLKFRLTRECKNKEKEILQEWEYIQSVVGEDNGNGESKKTFTVTFCECLDCFHIDCCKYIIELIQVAS